MEKGILKSLSPTEHICNQTLGTFVYEEGESFYATKKRIEESSLYNNLQKYLPRSQIEITCITKLKRLPGTLNVICLGISYDNDGAICLIAPGSKNILGVIHIPEQVTSIHVIYNGSGEADCCNVNGLLAVGTSKGQVYLVDVKRNCEKLWEITDDDDLSVIQLDIVQSFNNLNSLNSSDLIDDNIKVTDSIALSCEEFVPVTYISHSPILKLLFIGFQNGNISIWSIYDYKLITSIECFNKPINKMLIMDEESNDNELWASLIVGETNNNLNFNGHAFVSIVELKMRKQGLDINFDSLSVSVIQKIELLLKRNTFLSSQVVELVNVKPNDSSLSVLGIAWRVFNNDGVRITYDYYWSVFDMSCMCRGDSEIITNVNKNSKMFDTYNLNSISGELINILDLKVISSSQWSYYNIEETLSDLFYIITIATDKNKCEKIKILSSKIEAHKYVKETDVKTLLVLEDIFKYIQLCHLKPITWSDTHNITHEDQIFFVFDFYFDMKYYKKIKDLFKNFLSQNFLSPYKLKTWLWNNAVDCKKLIDDKLVPPINQQYDTISFDLYGTILTIQDKLKTILELHFMMSNYLKSNVKENDTNINELKAELFDKSLAIDYLINFIHVYKWFHEKRFIPGNLIQLKFNLMECVQGTSMKYLLENFSNDILRLWKTDKCYPPKSIFNVLQILFLTSIPPLIKRIFVIYVSLECRDFNKEFELNNIMKRLPDDGYYSECCHIALALWCIDNDKYTDAEHIIKTRNNFRTELIHLLGKKYIEGEKYLDAMYLLRQMYSNFKSKCLSWTLIRLNLQQGFFKKALDIFNDLIRRNKLFNEQLLTNKKTFFNLLYKYRDSNAKIDFLLNSEDIALKNSQFILMSQNNLIIDHEDLFELSYGKLIHKFFDTNSSRVITSRDAKSILTLPYKTRNIPTVIPEIIATTVTNTNPCILTSTAICSGDSTIPPNVLPVTSSTPFLIPPVIKTSPAVTTTTPLLMELSTPLNFLPAASSTQFLLPPEVNTPLSMELSAPISASVPFIQIPMDIHSPITFMMQKQSSIATETVADENTELSSSYLEENTTIKSTKITNGDITETHIKSESNNVKAFAYDTEESSDDDNEGLTVDRNRSIHSIYVDSTISGDTTSSSDCKKDSIFVDTTISGDVSDHIVHENTNVIGNDEILSNSSEGVNKNEETIPVVCSSSSDSDDNIIIPEVSKGEVVIITSSEITENVSEEIITIETTSIVNINEFDDSDKCTAQIPERLEEKHIVTAPPILSKASTVTEIDDSESDKETEQMSTSSVVKVEVAPLFQSEIDSDSDSDIEIAERKTDSSKHTPIESVLLFKSKIDSDSDSDTERPAGVSENVRITRRTSRARSHSPSSLPLPSSNYGPRTKRKLSPNSEVNTTNKRRPPSKKTSSSVPTSPIKQSKLLASSSEINLTAAANIVLNSRVTTRAAGKKVSEHLDTLVEEPSSPPKTIKNEPTVAKRGRGRSRGISVSSDDVVVKRGRGRGRISESSDDITVKRGRGRGRISESSDDITVKQDLPSTSSSSNVNEPSVITKRGRGRPSISRALSEPPSNDEPSNKKRTRKVSYQEDEEISPVKMRTRYGALLPDNLETITEEVRPSPKKGRKPRSQK